MVPLSSATTVRAHAQCGRCHVRLCRPSFTAAYRLMPDARAMWELRAHALKLRFFPEKHPGDESGVVLDVDWSWIQALKGKGVGELRINEVIGGHDNLRVIFFQGDEKMPDLISGKPIIWILHVMQKKRQRFTPGEIEVMRGRRALVMERYYKSYELGTPG